MPTIIYGNFEWDEDKNKSNLEKHDIAFEEATEIFYLDRYNSKPYLHAGLEFRSFSVGKINDVEITVVYTLRNARIRIISARRASYEEREYYRKIVGNQG